MGGCSPAPLLSGLTVEPAAISPDGDGEADVARIGYAVGRPVDLTLELVGEDGKAYTFRDARPREAGQFEALFGGVIDGRVVPDGDYQVRLVAKAEDGEQAELTSTLAVTGGDREPPRLDGLAVAPDRFSPNQDGLGDRVKISYSLSEEATVRLWLERADGGFVRDILEDLDSAEQAGEVGPHTYDFDAGVDADAPPPPNGDYQIMAEARDAAGNLSRQSLDLVIEQQGQPRAGLVGNVAWSSAIVEVGSTLWFTVTLQNHGATPLRTHGPAPGFVYDSNRSFNQRAPAGTWLLARVGRPGPDSDQPYRAASAFVPAGRSGETALRLAPLDLNRLASRRDPYGVAGSPAARAAPDPSAMSPSPALCGTVTGDDGRPADGAELFAFDAAGAWGRRVTLDAAGAFCVGPAEGAAGGEGQSFAPSPGAMRIGLANDALESDVDYPFRWQAGPMEALDVCDAGGRLYLCLAPGTEAIVSGGLRFTDKPNRRTSKVYLSLQHEDVRMIQGPFGVKEITVEGE